MLLDEELAPYAPHRPSVCTIGVFDGVHVGHQALVRRTIEEARGRGHSSGVVVFHPHPRDVLVPGTHVPVLTPLEDRVRLLKDLGADVVVPVSFTLKLSKLSARQFMSSLVQHLRLAGIVSGPDFAVGKDRGGDLPALIRLGEELGYTVTVIEPLGEPARKISSSAIRNAVGSGEVDAAARLLGRPYSTRGKVIHGAARGRTLGYPTANLRIDAGVALPGDGIYATRARADGSIYASASYVGSQPTFNGNERSIEVFLFDFQGDLYGDDLEVEWVSKVRDDRRFDSQDALVRQMAQDVDQARAVLASERG